ncbi:hypothetical protein RHECNPAF_1260029 [Rhizobium etli CNPAF512]|nr:hypothetical protein RHECNPAF_1260029 [Rhizobium etli CNPAF512]
MTGTTRVLPQHTLEIAQILRNALADKGRRAGLRLLLLVFVISSHVDRVMSVVHLRDEVGDGKLQSVGDMTKALVLGRKPQPRAEIKQDVGDMRDYQLAILQEGWREGNMRFAFAFHDIEHGTGAAAGLTGDVDVIGAGFLQRKPDEFTATLDAVPIIKLIGHLSSILRFTTEVFSQFVLGFFKSGPSFFRQLVAGAVDVEGQHRHGRAEGTGLTAMTLLGRMLDRAGDLLRIVRFEHTFLQVHRVAVFGDVLRPFLLRFGHVETSLAAAGRQGCRVHRQWWLWCSLRLRVAAAFLAEADLSSVKRAADAAPPARPPFSEDSCVSFLPRPEPDLLPPPLSLLTVAQARRSASFSETPRSS